MKIVFPHINGPFDGYLRFTELEGVSRVVKEDDFVTKTPTFKAWPVVICYTYRGHQRAIRFPSVVSRDLTYNKIIELSSKKSKEIVLTSDDFTQPSISDELAFSLLRQHNVTHDLYFETSRVCGEILKSNAFCALCNPGNLSAIMADATLLPDIAVEIFTLTLLVPKTILQLGVTRKQYFKYKCGKF